MGRRASDPLARSGRGPLPLDPEAGARVFLYTVVMKYIGIDYGRRRIGIALSDDGGTIAFPRATIDNDADALGFIRRLIEEEQVEEIVIGDTRTVSGAPNDVTLDAERFADMLTRDIGRPVERAFEGWSSIEAARYAPEAKQHDDSAAAAIILQRYLDMRG